MSTATETAIPALNRDPGANREQSLPNEKIWELSEEHQEEDERFDDQDMLV